MKGRLTLPGGAALDLSSGPLVMAVVNCNGDSFYPPSRRSGPAAVERALEALEEGAGIIDFGGESTRPGSAYISAEEEAARIIPVIEGFRRQSGSPVSVDTWKAGVARAALDAGADIINDISALEGDPDMGSLAAGRGAAVVLMHKLGDPKTMQRNPFYNDIKAELRAYLAQAAGRALGYGIEREKIILDPGIGFGKRLEDNLDIIAHLAEICGGDYPILVGLSRKSFIGELTGLAAEDRLAGTLFFSAAALSQGAGILRTHDVRETAGLIKAWRALEERRGKSLPV